jgi:hypothetical protein
MRRFCSGSVTPLRAPRKMALASICSMGTPTSPKEGFHLGGFVQAHEAGVDVDAAHLHAGTGEQHGEHGAVHAAGDAADDFAAADFGFDALDHLGLELLDVELGECGTAFGEEVLQDGGAFVGMRDLRVKLDAPAAVGPFQSDGDGVFIGGDDFRCAGEVCAGVAVAHPDLGFVRDAARRGLRGR